jgi:hypothetical protein
LEEEMKAEWWKKGRRNGVKMRRIRKRKEGRTEGSE